MYNRIVSKESKLTYQARYRENNREKLREAATARRRAMRKQVFDHYGNICVSCGFADHRALQIDHIYNDGAKERKSLGGQNVSGWRFYDYLIKQGLPEGYQTLCANCNMIKQLNNMVL